MILKVCVQVVGMDQDDSELARLLPASANPSPFIQRKINPDLQAFRNSVEIQKLDLFIVEKHGKIYCLLEGANTFVDICIFNPKIYSNSNLIM